MLSLEKNLKPQKFATEIHKEVQRFKEAWILEHKNSPEDFPLVMTYKEWIEEFDAYLNAGEIVNYP